ncbi:hypothetical protein ACS0TY_014351 [Phlomoides rotata]
MNTCWWEVHGTGESEGMVGVHDGGSTPMARQFRSRADLQISKPVMGSKRSDFGDGASPGTFLKEQLVIWFKMLLKQAIKEGGEVKYTWSVWPNCYTETTIFLRRNLGKPVELRLLNGTLRLQYTSAPDGLILLQSAATLPFFEVFQCH